MDALEDFGGKRHEHSPQGLPAAAGKTPVNSLPFVPPSINGIEDTGLSPLWLQEHVLKVMYFSGVSNGF
jgi:hypothetical protein